LPLSRRGWGKNRGLYIHQLGVPDGEKEYSPRGNKETSGGVVVNDPLKQIKGLPQR
jgi:hypothetical protein